MKISKSKKRILEGEVTSAKMKKTILVRVVNKSAHSMYDKPVIKRRKYKVHDEKNIAKVGDKVKIIESRPYSKDKSFRLLEVLK